MSKTILVFVFLMAGTLLTTTVVTIVPAAYADNENEAEDESAAAIADCDDNEVERAGFDCIAIAANDVEEESATLSVCKEVRLAGSSGLSPEDFDFTVTGNNPSPEEFAGDNSDGCVDVTIGPGDYAVSEVWPIPFGGRTEIEGNCEQDPPVGLTLRATGEIQSGETQECRFINLLGP
jgi:hypothetical protein